MEESVPYDSGNPVERANLAIAHALASGVHAPVPDHFESQAQATLSQWAALRRALERANEMIDDLRAENAEGKARIGELVRANAQLSESLDVSLARESEAKEQSGYLKGIMTSAAAALMEGMGAGQREFAREDLARSDSRRINGR